jgi:hypothetical protein
MSGLTTFTEITGRAPGTYEYRSELINASGLTESAVMSAGAVEV